MVILFSYRFAVLTLFGLSSYIIAAFAYFVFMLLLFAARNRTLSGALILMACIATLSSLALSAFHTYGYISIKAVFLFEDIKLICWSLLIFATRHHLKSRQQLWQHKLFKQHVLLLIIAIAPAWLAGYVTVDASKYLFISFLILNLWLSVQLEQLYRNANLKSKWALWPLIIGLGAVCVFDFVLFAQASMLNQLDFTLWYIRALVSIISVPFLLISTRRMKNWSVDIFISREVVFYSSMLMISGLYLLLMAFAGYVINFVGGHWGNLLSISFVVMGIVVLAALLMTERLRREVKVFITKHFFANRYDYRVEWLKLIDQLELNQQADYYKTALTIIRGSMDISYGAILKKKPSGRFEVLYSEGITINQALLSQLKIVDQYCENNAWIVDIREYNRIDNSYPKLQIDSNIFVDSAVNIIVPIISAQTHYGFFLLSSPFNDNRLLNWEDRDLLTAIAKQLNHFLALNEANEKLAFSKQFDAFNRMSAFLMHDLKNVQAQLALINANAQRHRDNPEFIDDVFDTVDSATQRLDKMLHQLRNKTVLDTKLAHVHINKLLTSVVAQRNLQQPQVTLEIDEDIQMMIDAETFASVINHLLQNAQEATKADGWVTIKASYFEQSLNLAISDNGQGMSDKFIKTRLFNPFDTTKGNAGMGIGVFEAKQFIEGLGGSIQVTSFEQKGTTFLITIPDNQF